MTSIDDSLKKSPEGVAEKKEWTQIAEAYKEAIEEFPPYQMLVDTVVGEVIGQDKILDLGCGTGAQIKRILDIDMAVETVGVDSSKPMLDIALERLIETHPDSNFRLYHGDATTFRAEKGFDAVISSNVLFNLSHPMEHLDTAYNLLQPGGIFVITSAAETPDMDTAQQMMEGFFKQQGNYKEKKQFIDTVWQVNRSFLGTKFNVYSSERMREILLDHIGFDRIITDKAVYGGKNFLLTAQKGEKRDLDFKISDDPKMMEAGFSLRYHQLHERYNFIPKQDLPIYKDECDERSIGFFALERGTDKVVGFLNYVPPGDDIPFKDKQALKEIAEKHGDVGAFNGFYIVNTKNQRGLGNYMIASMMQFAKLQGVDALVTEANPEIVKLGPSLGWETVGETYMSEGNNGKKTPSTPMATALKNDATQEIIRRKTAIYEKRHAAEEVKQPIS
ncbi:MAG: class I SAM-dependent methyltransferase [bacterium]|nr:class I SAM-dependent methyltransferase [bacterium]